MVIVTGASAGIGRATARGFARRGAHVGLIARGEDGFEAARREVEAVGDGAVAIPCDVSGAGAVERAAARVEGEFGPIDLWVNNAFAGIFSEALEVTSGEYKRVTDVTHLGQVWATMAALARGAAEPQSALECRGLSRRAREAGDHIAGGMRLHPAPPGPPGETRRLRPRPRRSGDRR